jgi:hypothetical protein
VERQLQALPAEPETVAVWMAALADGDDTRKPLARSSINQALSAVIMRHRDAGVAFNRKHPATRVCGKVLAIRRRGEKPCVRQSRC